MDMMNRKEISKSLFITDRLEVFGWFKAIVFILFVEDVFQVFGECYCLWDGGKIVKRQ
jgi:hypothetical protein